MCVARKLNKRTELQAKLEKLRENKKDIDRKIKEILNEIKNIEDMLIK